MTQTVECKKTLFPGGVATTFQGKTREYCIETYRTPNGHTLTDIPEYSGLVDVITGLYLGVYPNRDKNISIERMKRSLSHPRTILELATYEGKAVGFGIFPRLLIDVPGSKESVPVVYSTRAFLKDHEGGGLGTHVLSEAIQLHQEVVARGNRRIYYVALMTQNPLSVLTLGKIPDVETIFPFDALYATDPTAQHLMLGVHNEAMMSSENINTITGVSTAELKEIGMNETYRPDREQTKAWEIYQRMVIEFQMNRERGDVVYVLCSFRRPHEVVSVPVGQAA